MHSTRFSIATPEEERAFLRRSAINAKMAHARWAGRRLAKFLLLINRDNKINARGMFSEEKYSSTMIAEPYCVHPVLVEYALKVCREKLNGPARSRVA